MECKHEDSLHVECLWRIFNDAFKVCNGPDEKFLPHGWVTDMAGANFVGLSKIYGDDVAGKIKRLRISFPKVCGKVC